MRNCCVWGEYEVIFGGSLMKHDSAGRLGFQDFIHFSGGNMTGKRDLPESCIQACCLGTGRTS